MQKHRSESLTNEKIQYLVHHLLGRKTTTVWKLSKYGVFSSPYFSYIRTEYGDLRSKFPYSVRIQENTDQKISVFGHVSRSVHEKLSEDDI